MSWTFEVKDTAPAFTGPNGGKYISVIQAVIDLDLDKWLTISGFSDVTECEKMQSAMGGSGGARRAARDQGCRLYTHRYTNESGEIELWIQKVKELQKRPAITVPNGTVDQTVNP